MSSAITIDDLQRLPLRAIVALCARCAMRMRAGFDLPGNVPDRGVQMAAVDDAVRLARDYAGGTRRPTEAGQVASAAMRAAGAAPADMLGVEATKVGWAVAAVEAAQNGETHMVAARAERCIRAQGVHGEAARRDFDGLVRLGLGAFPELGNPVNVAEDGPLGPLWAAEHGLVD